jgi:hypothetical protein
MAQYTVQIAESLLPKAEQTPNTLRFFRWVLSIYEYFFVHANCTSYLRPLMLSGQVGVLVEYCKRMVGVDVQVKDNYSTIFFPYRAPYDCEIIISEDATTLQYNAIVQLFEFYKLAGKRFVYRVGETIIVDSGVPYTYFEIGLSLTPNTDNLEYFEMGLNP